ncbi:microsomal glutathione S-transferase 1 isoform X2 [Aethina tumida]|nr:microsomal glutathione S-transferase 1 isoform X2 [Aethina tumida]XP_049824917.1 microsomal glutathione S-transferase 1 isoform X2 [Aethina tumida]
MMNGIKENLLECYVFYASILCLKLLFMSILVGLARVYHKAVFNVEDSKYGSFQLKTDETVERYRRAHLNDLESIPVFLVSSFLFLLTEPSTALALWIFRIYTLTRISHTFNYCVVKSTILRIISYDLGLYLNLFVVLRTIYYYL